MALRPCNDANQMFKRITFGLITGGTSGEKDDDEDDGGDGILVYSKGVISVYFQGVAFDSAGLMVWNFTAPLIDPADPDEDLSVRGMHFWAQAAITFPLSRKSKGEIHSCLFVVILRWFFSCYCVHPNVRLKYRFR